MNRYENGKIYKIVDVGYNKMYIGSTCESLSKRMERHRASYKHYLKRKYNKARSFEIFDDCGMENCKIELIEHFSCNNKDELRKREGHFIRASECINKCIAGRTIQEWKQDNAEHQKQTSKDYCNKKMEEIKQHKKQTFICECGSGYTLAHKARHKKSQKHQDWLKQQEEE